MKMVFAIVQPFKLEEIKNNLEQIPDFPGMTVGSVRGFGREHAELSPEALDHLLEDFSDKVQVETVVDDGRVEEVIDAITRGGHTGRYGDGIIFVVPVERFVRIASAPGGASRA